MAPRPLRPWLTGILSRHAANLMRKRQAQRENRQNGSKAERSVTWDTMPSSEQGPLARASASELQGDLQRALTAMPERYRRVLEPYLLEEVRPAEIARSLEVSPGTVRTQLHRGLERLRRILPASMVLGTITQTRGFSAMRSAVLHHGQMASPTILAGAGGALAVSSPLVTASSLASAGGVFGGLIVVKKMFLAAGVALACVVGYQALPSESNSLTPQGESPVQAPGSPAEVALNAGPGGSTLAAAPDPLQGPEYSAQGEERQAITTGKLWLEGKLMGVRAEHMGQVKAMLRITEPVIPTSQ